MIVVARSVQFVAPPSDGASTVSSFTPLSCV